MELKLSGSNKKIEIADAVFACEYNKSLIHQIVTAYMAGGRAGTKAQKTRSEVSGGGAKPFKQKGTGRARAGTIRSPLWRTGGKVFAAKPRNYEQKVNKKMYKGALRSIVSELVRQDRIMVVDSFEVEQPKTKFLADKLKKLNLEGNILIISDKVEENLYLSARNLTGVALFDAASSTMDPVTLISADKVIVTESALKELEGLLS
jgi:large subunit ribosomal protein L4